MIHLPTLGLFAVFERTNVESCGNRCTVVVLLLLTPNFTNEVCLVFVRVLLLFLK